MMPHVDYAEWVVSQKQLQEAVGDVIPAQHEGPERRNAPRYPLSIVIDAVSLDDQFKPNGESFSVLSRDISTGGIGLVHPQPIQAKYLGLTLRGEGDVEIRVVAEVLHCHAIGPSENQYSIGARFVTRVE